MGTENPQPSPEQPRHATTDGDTIAAPEDGGSTLGAPYGLTVEHERLDDGRSIHYYSAPDSGQL